MAGKNVFYAQSGGVTSVINASALGVFDEIAEHPDTFGQVFAGKNGIIGALQEELIDISELTERERQGLMHTPAGAFGSCRYKLKDIDQQRAQYERLIDVFQAHDIGYFFYNGGGDSQDTANKVSQLSKTLGYPITCIGVPKTIDNDLPHTDCCPGFGSVAKYVATSIREAALDVESMAASSTKVFILEVMGRHAGWIAGAAGLAQNDEHPAPHIILFPERVFDRAQVMAKIAKTVEAQGFCAIVASEGIRDAEGRFVAETGVRDAFGHAQLGGVAQRLAEMVRDDLGLKYHYAIADYLQRSARHIASQTDVDQAYALGRHAALLAHQGANAVMPTIVRTRDDPYSYTLGQVPLADVANIEKPMPDAYITDDGFGITDAARTYFAPLIEGEAFPPFHNGLPDYVRLQYQLVKPKLAPFTV
jgi:ATP-dependent phosphofructokinase / diphosphate-dependent phosphofructokinase